ncbi:MAG: hypothetical protein HYR85_07320 [Planctomycetes bacterium]|nr:hypothetical protein [Planctomycetota bacterium]MBI3847566.1 hypothetical protein [Planctomycetota bacterium]
MRNLVRYVIVTAFVVSTATMARATDYWTPAEICARFAEQNAPARRDDGTVAVALGFTSPDATSQIADVARFLSTLQVSDFGSADYGGIREGELLRDIVQSDNTHEAVWVWSRYEELTGDPSYRPNIDAAWFYLAYHPAFGEEGGSGPDGYYRVYNCAWALRAEIEYRRATGDPTHLDYARTCARYVLDWPLDFAGSAISPLNAMVEAWAAGNLYEFAVDQDDAVLRDSAASVGSRVKSWVDAAPRGRLAIQMWAMSGGALFWGIVESHFRLHRDEARAWIAANAPHLPEHEAAGTWNNAHDAWCALGHWTAFRALASASHAESTRNLVEGLLAQDLDQDGGIPSSFGGLDVQDESWVSSYLACLGLDKRLPTLQLVASPHAMVVSRGGSLVVDVAALQWTTGPLFVMGATFGFDVDGSAVELNPLLGPLGFTLPARHARAGSLRIHVPARTPSGVYALLLRMSRADAAAHARLRIVVR